MRQDTFSGMLFSIGRGRISFCWLHSITKTRPKGAENGGKVQNRIRLLPVAAQRKRETCRNKAGRFGVFGGYYFPEASPKTSFGRQVWCFERILFCQACPQREVWPFPGILFPRPTISYLCNASGNQNEMIPVIHPPEKRRFRFMQQKQGTVRSFPQPGKHGQHTTACPSPLPAMS